MPRYLAPGLYFERRDAAPALAALRMDITAFVGLAERGPLDTPTAVHSWEQFATLFGGFIANAFLAYGIKAFFENGGRTAVIVRIAAKPCTTKTDHLKTQPADRLSSYVVATDGYAVGTVVAIRQTLKTATATVAQPPDRLSLLCIDVTGFRQRATVRLAQSGNIVWMKLAAVDIAAGRIYFDRPLPAILNPGAPIDASTDVRDTVRVDDVAAASLQWSRPLSDAFDLRAATLAAAPLEFASGATAARTQFLSRRGTPALRVSAATPGVWGDRIGVRVSQHATATVRTLRRPDPADAALTPVDSVLGFATGTLARVTQGSVRAYRVVKQVDAASGIVVWESPLSAGFTFDHADAADRPLVSALAFSLVVDVSGEVREVHRDLGYFGGERDRTTGKLKPYVQLPLISSLITAEVAAAVSATTVTEEDYPDPLAANLVDAHAWLTDGLDGTAALQVTDLLGDRTSAVKLGLRTLEDRNDIGLVAVPDIVIRPVPPTEFDAPPKTPIDPCLPHCSPDVPRQPPPPVPLELAPRLSLDAIARVQQGVVAHCELMRDRVALIDAPPLAQPGNCVERADIMLWRRRFDSSYAALYYPWVRVPDPLRLDGEVVRAIPPCGFVAGLCGKADFTIGVHRSPANFPLQWAPAASRAVSQEEQALLNPRAINCLRTLVGDPLTVYGARTLSSDPDWRYLSVRRLLLLIEKTLRIALQWAVFEPNSVPLKLALAQSIAGFLTSLWERGALAGTRAEEAFYVRFEPAELARIRADNGGLLVEVGVAPVNPAEFVVVRIGRTSDTLLVSEGADANAAEAGT